MKPVLLLVDLQCDFLAMPELQPPADTLVARAAALLDGCRKRHIPVIHIWTTIHRSNDWRLPHWQRADRWICVAGTAGHKPPDVLRPLDNEIVVNKTGFNAFANGELDTALQKIQCDTVILAGLHLHACVRIAAVECLERGYQIHIAEDVVTSNDPVHAAATSRWLTERCIVCEPWTAVLDRMDNNISSIMIHRSPRCTDSILFKVPIAGVGEIESAVKAGRIAGTIWRRTVLSSRQRLLESIAVRLEAAALDLARQMAVEIGKPLSYGLEEVSRAIQNLKDVASNAAVYLQQKKETAGIVRYQPLGLVAIISAWNNPVAIPLGKIAPALVCGNTVVWKPAPAATHIAQVILQLMLQAGMPANAVCLLPGDNTTARQLASNVNINAVTITGSISSGYVMQEICARRIVPLQAELSGNNAAIVWDDADMVHAASQVVWGAFAFAGQRCTANRRVIIHASQFESFIRELEKAANKLIWGDPLKEDTVIGPVISLHKRDEITAMVDRIQSNNDVQRIVFLHGARAEQSWVKAGAYMPPVIICCDNPNHAIVQEETMCPLLVVQRAKDFGQALELCNGVRHGLIAALFSTSPDLQGRFLEEACAGVLKFNESTAGVDVTLPFGGWKASGIGPPEHGEGDYRFYTRIQTVYSKP